jgi:hypothetical protein
LLRVVLPSCLSKFAMNWPSLDCIG